MIYVVRVGGDFMHYRFMFQAYPTLAVAAAIALAQLAARTPRSAVIAGAGALALAAISFGRVQLESRFYMQSLREMDDYTTVGRRVGEALERALPPDTVIATTLAGTIAYYSELETIDQWGLNDRFIAHQDLVNRRSRGHVKRAPDSYLRSRHTNLHFWHPVVCSCTHPCNESVPNVFIRLAPLERDECVRSWYMTPTPALTAHLCAHPEQFVLNQIACPAAPSR